MSTSGTLIFRDTSKKMPKGKKLMLVFGVVAVDENFPIAGESMVYVKSGDAFMMPDLPGVTCFALQTPGTPIDPKYSGWDVSQLLTEPIWRA